MKPQPRSLLVSALCVLVIALAGGRLWFSQSERTDLNVKLQQGIGERLAALAVESLAGRGKLAVATLEAGQSEELDLQFAAFKRALADHPAVTITDVDHVDSEGRAKYGVGRGLSARRLQRMIGKYADADLVVSFIGAPDPDDLKEQPLPAGHPRLLPSARNAKELYELFKLGLVQAAVVPRYEFPAPGPERPRTPSEWFDRHCQVVQLATDAGGR
jgi:hypothetical protein